MCLTEFFGGDDADRLVFTANATEALNIAIHGLFEPGEHVITTQLEHNSVLRPLYMQRERGVGVDIVPCSDVGHNLLFIVDASQTAGVIPIDVKDMNIDVLCFTGHKGLMGPQGTGGLYVGRESRYKAV